MKNVRDYISRPSSFIIENQTLEILVGYNTNSIVCYKDDLELYQKNPSHTENHFIKFEATIPEHSVEVNWKTFKERNIIWGGIVEDLMYEYTIVDFDGYMKGNDPV